MPLSPVASSWINPNAFLLLAVVKPGPFSMKVPIPNNQTLNGIQASVQVWWGNNSQLPLFQPSNGVLLTVGN